MQRKEAQKSWAKKRQLPHIVWDADERRRIKLICSSVDDGSTWVGVGRQIGFTVSPTGGRWPNLTTCPQWFGEMRNDFLALRLRRCCFRFEIQGHAARWRLLVLKTQLEVTKIENTVKNTDFNSSRVIFPHNRYVFPRKLTNTD
jgi:hypothetical protein